MLTQSTVTYFIKYDSAILFRLVSNGPLCLCEQPTPFGFDWTDALETMNDCLSDQVNTLEYSDLKVFLSSVMRKYVVC